MCYANPGPRCSAHAAENLKKAKNLLTSAQDKAKQSVAKLSEIPKTDPRRAEAEKKHAENKLAISQIQTLVRVAEIEYDATPKGIEDLKKKLADASPADAQHLQDVLYRAKRTRERMLDLYALQTAGAATDNSNGYHITGNMPNGLADRAARVVGEHNVYVGKKSDPSPDQEELYRTTQQRVDLLVSYFRKADGAVEAQELVVKAYKDLDLTPGFTLIDNGFYRAAYRDDVTGQVIKIPLNVRFDKQEMNVVTVNEQKSYALIDLDDLKAEKIEYVETHFYTPTEHSQYPVVVQPYLDPDEYKPVKDLATEFYLSKVALKPGIWDTHVGNARVKTDGTVVLFDCLDINET